MGLFVRAARMNFLPASCIPFLTGAALAFRDGAALSPAKFILGLLGVASAHLAGNLLNDLFDHISGADAGNKGKSPFFGGSGVIQEGLLSPGKMRSLAVTFLLFSLVCGLMIFIITKDPVFIAMMVLAGVLTVEYTAPPLRFAYRRLGELDIFFLFGVFMVMASFYLFTGRFTLDSFVAALPVSFLVGAVILCNEVPDFEADMRSGKRNLISLSGKRRGYTLYSAAIALSYISILLNVADKLVPVLTAGMAVLYLLGVSSAKILKDKPGSPDDLIRASALTIALHALVGSGMIAGILIK